MVFSGKPSPACLPCRQRRTKCDLQRPACTPCRNTQRECGGYRDTHVLRVREERPAFTTKQSSRQVQRRQRTSSPVAAASKETIPLVIYQSLHQNHQYVAINYFFHHYAEGSHVKYLGGLYKPEITPYTSTLHKTVAAVSLTCLSYARNAPSLQTEARFNYAQALGEINLALQRCPKDIGIDIVASILLLAYYVALSPEMKQTSDQWATHINGALSVIMVQSPSRFSSPGEQRLLHHVLSMKQIDSVQRGTTIPADLIALYGSLMAGEYQTQFWEALHELAMLKAYSPTSNTTEHLDSMRRLNNLDQKIVRLQKLLPIALSDSLLLQPGGDHVDTLGLELERERAYNTLRMMQLAVHETLADTMLLGYDHHDSYQPLSEPTRSGTAVENISIQIFDSVSSWRDRTSKQGDNGSSIGAWGQSFLWPLMMLGKCKLLSLTSRDRASEYLSIIAAKIGLPEALAAAIRLKSGNHSEDWTHALYLS